MYIRIIAILAILLPFQGIGQSSQSIDFTGGIDYSYRHLNGDKGLVNVLNNWEEGKLNWRVGFNYNRQLGSRFFLRSGLRLASVGYKTRKTELRWGSEHDGNGGWNPDPDLPSEIQFIQNYWFLKVPIAGRFEFNNKKLSPFIELGIAPSVYLTSRIKTISNLENTVDMQRNKSSDFNQIHIVGFASFGLNYALSKRFQLFGQPIFWYHFTPLIDAPIKEHLFNYGLEIGIRNRFK